MIADRLRALDAAEAQARVRERETSVGSRSAPADKGYIEEKWITSNGKPYGPYLYRRWWEDGTLRSKYLGKAADRKKAAKKK